MKVGVLVPGTATEVGSVQIYAKSVGKAFKASGEAEVSLYFADTDLDRFKQDLVNGKFDIVQVENRPLRLPQVSDWIQQSGVVTALVLNLHSLNFVEYQPCGLKAMWQALALADAIVVNSKAVQKRFELLFKHEAARAFVVYPGVDPEAFTPEPLQQDINLSAESLLKDRGPIVLFAGRLVERKGLAIAVEAVNLLKQTYPNIALAIAGGWGKNSDSVTYLGPLQYEQMPRAYGLADVFICPSQLFEAFGLVNVEAMANGLPVVASKIGGIPEIVQHGVTGYLVDDFWKPASFAESLKLALDPSIKKTMGDAGRHVVLDKFRWEHTKNGFRQIYNNLLSEEKKP